MATNAGNIVLNGRKGLSALLLALALLVVTAAGAVTAEQAANAQTLENDELDELMLNAVYVDADTDLAELDEQTRLALELAGESDDSDEGVLARELSDDWQGVDPLPWWHPTLTPQRCANPTTDSAAEMEDCDELEVVGVVVIIYTDGHIAWVVVVVIFEDGSSDVSRHGPMRLSAVRERLADFDGRIIVHWLDFDDADDDDDTGCASGLLAGQYAVNDDGQGGVFRAQIMNANGDTIGYMGGQYQNGQYRGQFTVRGGSVSGTIAGTYANGTFHGVWADSDSDLNGAMRGQYMGTSEGQGVFRGQWKVNCNDGGDPVPLPTPIEPKIVCKKVTITTEMITGADAEALDFSNATTKTKVKVVCRKVIPYGDDVIEIDEPRHIKCKRVSADSESDESRCKVQALPLRPSVKPMPVEVDPADINTDKPTIEKLKRDASQLLDKELIETDGGFSVEVGDAAAGGALSSISLLGLGLLRRRFMLL
jgi:hypothetical protein